MAAKAAENSMDEWYNIMPTRSIAQQYLYISSTRTSSVKIVTLQYVLIAHGALLPMTQHHNK